MDIILSHWANVCRRVLSVLSNDFDVGTMGKKYNHGEDKWAEYLKTEVRRIQIPREEALKSTVIKRRKERCGGSDL